MCKHVHGTYMMHFLGFQLLNVGENILAKLVTGTVYHVCPVCHYNTKCILSICKMFLSEDAFIFAYIMLKCASLCLQRPSTLNQPTPHHHLGETSIRHATSFAGFRMVTLRSLEAKSLSGHVGTGLDATGYRVVWQLLTLQKSQNLSGKRIVSIRPKN